MRKATITRKTEETSVKITLHLDGEGKYEIDTSIPFMDHMLSQVALHGLFDLEVKAKGDIAIDFHHTIEDIGISLGKAFKGALGDKCGIKRYGEATIPLDEALACVVVDISGRSCLRYNVPLEQKKVGTFDTELIEEFFHAFVNHSGITLHINLLYGSNIHHILEAIFKAFGRAQKEAVQIDRRVKTIPSTKGKL